jgi:hypothetical protein
MNTKKLKMKETNIHYFTSTSSLISCHRKPIELHSLTIFIITYKTKNHTPKLLDLWSLHQIHVYFDKGTSKPTMILLHMHAYIQTCAWFLHVTTNWWVYSKIEMEGENAWGVYVLWEVHFLVKVIPCKI